VSKWGEEEEMNIWMEFQELVFHQLTHKEKINGKRNIKCF
jgi:hypothetical protein